MSDFTPQHPAGGPEHGGHEPSEIAIRRIFLFGVVLAALSAVVMVGLGVVMGAFAADEKKEGITTAELVKEDLRADDFPAPRLQHNTTFDMDEFRRREEAELSSYGWADRKAGIAQIPIAKAMERIAKDGLPKPAAPPKAVEPKANTPEPKK